MRVNVRGGRFVLAGALAAASIGAWPATTAKAALTPTCPVLNGSSASSSSTVSPTDGNDFLLCSYALTTADHRVVSFDGTPLRVDLSLPTVAYIPPGSTTAAKPPLVIFQSGYSNDYCQFESTTLAGSGVPGCADWIGTPGYHWNNAWFASSGYAAINFTPRGWYESCGKKLDNSYSYATDTACQGATSGHSGERSWVHLLDRRWEVHDAQFLAGLVADAAGGTLINPNQIVATGDSGGGGPSWDLGMTQDKVVLPTSPTTPTASDLVPWLSPNNTPLHLAAALPMYTWTDLVDSLLPNGTATDGFNGAPAPSTFNHSTPIGVEKQTYVGGLFAKGVSNVPSQPPDGAQYAAPLTDPTADLNKWFTEINAGEPTFSVNPDTPTILAEVGGPVRSSYAMPIPADNGLAPALNTRKPIFVMQGLTDPLFPGLQALTMINHLQAPPNSKYPVWAFLGDMGHSYAQNPLDVWQQAHNESNAFLQAALQATSLTQLSQLFTQPTITVDTTRCLPQQTLQTYTASSFGSIATSALTFTDTGAAQTTINPSGGGPESLMSDPILTGAKCVSMSSSQSDTNEAIYNFPVSSPVTLVGGPVINVNVVNVTPTVTATSAELAARLWDVDGSGNQTLITRSVFRIDPAPGAQAIPLSFQLWPNAWQLCGGDTLKLELTQTDAPTFRPDNEPFSMSLSGLKLKMPVVPGADCTAAVVMAESPLLPALPLVPVGVVGAAAWLHRRRSRVAN